MVSVIGARVVGALEFYAPGLAGVLSEQGYTVSGATQHMCFVAHLIRWMLQERMDVGDLTVSVIDRYLAQRRADGYVRYTSVKAFAPLGRWLCCHPRSPKCCGRLQLCCIALGGSWSSNAA